MSESQGMLRAGGHDLPPPSDDGDGAAAGSIGDYLKRQRLLRGITIEDLAADTRIPLRSLERLEAGYFDGVTDGFVRGFVRTVATALGLDADQTVARMLDEPVARKWDRDGVGLWRKQLLALVALVAVTAIGVLVLRSGWNLLVGGARRREVVVWRDPVHQLARDVAEGRFTIPAPADPEPESWPVPANVPESLAADVPGAASSVDPAVVSGAEPSSGPGIATDRALEAPPDSPPSPRAEPAAPELAPGFDGAVGGPS